MKFVAKKTMLERVREGIADVKKSGREMSHIEMTGGEASALGMALWPTEPWTYRPTSFEGVPIRLVDSQPMKFVAKKTVLERVQEGIKNVKAGGREMDHIECTSKEAAALFRELFPGHDCSGMVSVMAMKVCGVPVKVVNPSKEALTAVQIPNNAFTLDDGAWEEIEPAVFGRVADDYRDALMYGISLSYDPIYPAPHIYDFRAATKPAPKVTEKGTEVTLDLSKRKDITSVCIKWV